MHCRKCHAPSYQDPCSSCVGKARTEAEKASRTQPNTIQEVASSARDLFDRLRSKSVGQGDYDGTEWGQLESAIAFLANNLGVTWPRKPPPENFSEASTAVEPKPEIVEQKTDE
jgi:hypothetical protein